MPTEEDRNKREKAVAGALLVSEKEASKRMQGVVRKTSLNMATALQSSKGRPEAALRAVQEHVEDLEEGFSRATLEARVTARDNSREKQIAAIAAILLLWPNGKKVSEDFKREAKKGSLSPSFYREDNLRAELMGRNIAAAWGGNVIAKIQDWLGDTTAKPPVKDVVKTASELEARVNRVVVTEVADAHNSEAKRIHKALPDHIREGLRLEWSAVLDKRTCDQCESMHGSISDDEGNFRVGSPPLHTNCRCVTVPARRVATRRRAA